MRHKVIVSNDFFVGHWVLKPEVEEWLYDHVPLKPDGSKCWTIKFVNAKASDSKITILYPGGRWRWVYPRKWEASIRFTRMRDAVLFKMRWC